MEQLLFLNDEYYEDVVRPIMYNYIKDYRYFRRNAAIVMGNSGNTKWLPALERAAKDKDPLVADAANWAIQMLSEKNEKGEE